MKRLMALALAAVLCGCCSVKVCKEAGSDMVNVENSAFKLFGCLTLMSGNPEYPNDEDALLFKDSLYLDVQMMILDNYMEKHGYRSFENISTYKTQERALLFLFKREVLHTSAKLIR